MALDNEASTLIALGEPDMAAELLDRAAAELDEDAGLLPRLVNAAARAELARGRGRPQEAAAAFTAAHDLAFTWAHSRVNEARYVEGFTHSREREAQGVTQAHAASAFMAGLAAKEAGRLQEGAERVARRAGTCHAVG